MSSQYLSNSCITNNCQLTLHYTTTPDSTTYTLFDVSVKRTLQNKDSLRIVPPCYKTTICANFIKGRAYRFLLFLSRNHRCLANAGTAIQLCSAYRHPQQQAHGIFDDCGQQCRTSQVSIVREFAQRISRPRQGKRGPSRIHTTKFVSKLAHGGKI